MTQRDLQDEDILVFLLKKDSSEKVPVVDLLDRVLAATYQSDEELQQLRGFYRAWNNRKRKAEDELSPEADKTQPRQKSNSLSGSGYSLSAQPAAEHD